MMDKDALIEYRNECILIKNDYEVNIMVEKTIEDILKKYYDEYKEYYSRYREEDEKCFDIEDELKDTLTTLGVNYKLEITEVCDSPGYECSVLSIAYIEKNNNWGTLKLRNVLLEVM